MISESTISLSMTKRMEQPARTQKHIVAWDFSNRPSGTFYRVINEELGKSHPGGDYELIQKSVALCRDDFIASRLGALAEYFGAQVVSFIVVRDTSTDLQRPEAREFVDRILHQRLRRRGRHRAVSTRGRK